MNKISMILKHKLRRDFIYVLQDLIHFSCYFFNGMNFSNHLRKGKTSLGSCIKYEFYSIGMKNTKCPLESIFTMVYSIIKYNFFLRSMVFHTKFNFHADFKTT